MMNRKQTGNVSTRGWVLPLLLACALLPYANGEEPAQKPESTADEERASRQTHQARWYVRLEGLNIYPDLKDEKLLSGPGDTAFRVLTRGHEDFNTFSDQRDRGGLWAPQIGFGRDVGTKLSLFAQVGHASGILRTDQRNPSRLLLPIRSSLEMRRGGTFAVLGADYYPFGVPAQRRYKGLADRLRAVKPLAGLRFSYNRTRFDANFNLGNAPISRVMHVRMDKTWDIFNLYPVLGLELPLNRNTTLSVSATYNYPSQQKENLRGPGVSIALKRYLR